MFSLIFQHCCYSIVAFVCKEIKGLFTYLLLHALLTAGFCFVFLDQSFWTGASLAKPRHAIWGYLTAGITFFAIPFMLVFTFGMGHWTTSVLQGHLPVSASQAGGGKPLNC